MENSTAEKVEDYKNSIKIKAEELVTKEFPTKIMKLNELLETGNFFNKDLNSVHQLLSLPISDSIFMKSHSEIPVGQKVSLENCLPSNVTKVMALSSGSIPCNKSLCDLIYLAKPHIRQLVEDSNLLKMWVSYMIPKIEDGNNFGVSIQEDILVEIQNVESEAASFFEQISHYFTARGKMISKVAKYPLVDDYRRAIQELDEKEYHSLWLILCEVRNRYCLLHDIVIKNLDKIKKPRSSNAESLY